MKSKGIIQTTISQWLLIGCVNAERKTIVISRGTSNIVRFTYSNFQNKRVPTSNDSALFFWTCVFTMSIIASVIKAPQKYERIFFKF